MTKGTGKNLVPLIFIKIFYEGVLGVVNKKIKKIIIIGLALSTMISCLSVSSLVKNKQEKKQFTNTVVVSEDVAVLEKESVVETVKELSKLEILEMQLNKTIRLKEGKYFKKQQDIKYGIIGKYILNLNKISAENVLINGNEIIIFATEPECEVNINEDLTKFGDVERSFMSFGDLELTPEESNKIQKQLKESILLEMNLDENMNVAKEKASTSIEKSLSTLTKNNYSVEVRWVK